MWCSWGRRLITNNTTLWLPNQKQHNSHHVHTLYHTCSLHNVVTAATLDSSHQFLVTCSGNPSSARRAKRRHYAKRNPGVWHNQEHTNNEDGGGAPHNSTEQPSGGAQSVSHHPPSTTRPLPGSAARPLQAKADTTDAHSSGSNTRAAGQRASSSGAGGMRAQGDGNGRDASADHQGSWELVQVATRGGTNQYEYNTKGRRLGAAAAQYAVTLLEQQQHARIHHLPQRPPRRRKTRNPRSVHVAEPVWLVLAVAVVLVDRRGQVLMARRPPHKQWGGMWEFPGGKVEVKETPEAAAAREMLEEVGVEIDPMDLFPLTFASSSNRGKTHLLLPLYSMWWAGVGFVLSSCCACNTNPTIHTPVCTRWKGDARGCEGQEVQWTTLDKLDHMTMPPIDRSFVTAVTAAVELLQLRDQAR